MDYLITKVEYSFFLELLFLEALECVVGEEGKKNLSSFFDALQD